ncbi:ANTAR domain-containing protein [Actinomycetospora sp. CA-101289]|uniref:ANTAR domain-containing protein n=1 Tax=Actinomycetospora sp. CA-101289 TaxID=3239893 RepID=UPI003D96E768
MMDNPALLVLPAAVHQAEGALVACLGVPVEDAAELLQTRARDHGITVEEMADEVLAPFPGSRRNGHHARQRDL